MPAISKKFTLPNGKEIELYYIGRLALFLGRTPTTIRKWEIAGVLPDTCFRDDSGRRMYSQEQIDVIVECAEKAKIQQGISISHTSFSANVHKRLAEINQKYAEK